MDATQDDKVFLKDSNVLVTQSRFVAGGKTYAMRNISSVTKYKIPKKIGTAIFLIIVGLILLAFSPIIGGLIFIAGILWLILSKPKYSVRIQSNAGEADGFISKDEKYIQKIVDAVNNAIIHRG
tara:strand:- start:190 stop:561 length:372 start_codon:yes stop_codon:yes gene_type:complete